MITQESQDIIDRAEFVGERMGREALKMRLNGHKVSDERVWGYNPGSLPLVIWRDGSQVMITPRGRTFLIERVGEEVRAVQVVIPADVLERIAYEFLGRPVEQVA